ncbi:MAG: sensor histidine kinase [Lachnospirales bacterium]
MKKIEKIYLYIKSHITVLLLAIFILFSLLMVFSIKVYTEKEYKEYLIKKTYEAENIIATSLAANLKYAFFDIINIGANIATDSEIYTSSKQIHTGISTNKNELMLEDKLRSYAHSSKWITAINIYGFDKVIFQYDKIKRRYEVGGFELNEIQKEIFDKIYNRKANVPKFYVSFIQGNDANSIEQGNLSISFPFVQTIDDANVLVTTISFNTELISQYLFPVYVNSDNSATGMLTNDDGHILVSNDEKWIGKRHSEYIKEKYRGDVITITEPIEIEDIILNIDIDKSKLLEDVEGIYSRSFIIFTIIIFVLLLSLFFIIKKVIILPIQTIIYEIEKVEINKELEPIKIKGENEMWQLAQSFNEMQLTLKRNYDIIEQEYADKMNALSKQREAEIEALESQINAHFICNTINVINYEAIESGNLKVSYLLKKLSNILRYTFNNNEYVLFIQEIAWLEQYLFLQQYRFENLFDFEIDFPEMLLEWPCGKLILQPFVENSIMHGFKEIDRKGYIKITARLCSENILKVVIEDNGFGVDKNTEEIIKSAIKNPYKKYTKGIGISNAVARIYAYYGKTVAIEFTNKIGCGCSFTFKLPKPRKIKEWL